MHMPQDGGGCGQESDPEVDVAPLLEDIKVPLQAATLLLVCVASKSGSGDATDHCDGLDGTHGPPATGARSLSGSVVLPGVLTY